MSHGKVLRWHVVVDSGRGSPRSYRVAASALDIGRDPGAQIVLDSPHVSRRHVHVWYEEGAVWGRDVSTHGTRCDGQPLRADLQRLSPAADLEIGPFRVRVGLEEPTAEPDRGTSREREREMERRRRARELLLERLEVDAGALVSTATSDMKERVRRALLRIWEELYATEGLRAPGEREQWLREMLDEALGLGPLEPLLSDPSISEIMVVDRSTIYVERAGKVSLCRASFSDDTALRAAIERIVTPLGRRVDVASPMVDARLEDGSRVNAVIEPLALRGPCLTIRRFPKERLTMEDLLERGTLSPEMARFLGRAVAARRNVLISGGTGTGKTTLLNVLSRFIGEEQRVVTIEDAAELSLAQPHVVPLEARPPNAEGAGRVTIRDLVRNALRMRPDRIVVGECRGSEALDMLQAMNTGHDGSMTTTHANTSEQAVQRLETLCLLGDVELPIQAIRRQLAASIDVIVQLTRGADGQRRITRVTEVLDTHRRDDVELRDIFEFRVLREEPGERVQGEFRRTGYLPSFLDTFIRMGLATEEDVL